MSERNQDRVPNRRDRLDLGDLWQVLRRSYPLIVAGAVLTLALVVVVTLASRMSFRTRGSLYLGELQERAPARSFAPGQWDFMGGESGDVGTEIEILRSSDLMLRAVLESGLNVAVAPADVSPPRFWRWRLSGRDAERLDAGLRKLAISGASADGAAGTQEYRLRVLGGGSFEVWRAGERLGIGAFGREFRGGGLRLKADAGPDGAPAPGAIYTVAVSPLASTADDAARALAITVPKVTGPGDAVKVVAVEFADASPMRAARFVDALMRLYLERRQSWKTEEATHAETFVAGQVRGMKDALDDAERKLADYKKNSNVVVLSDEAKGLIEQLGKYEEQRVAARLRVAAFGQVQDLLKQEHAPIEQYLVGETEDPVLAGLSNSLAAAQQELRKVEERFTPDAPAAREQQAQVDGQLKTIRDYVLGRSMRAQRQLDSLGQMIAQFEKKLRTVPGAQFDLAQLTRNAEVLSKMYSFLLERQQQAAVTKASTMSRNRVLDAALVPYREASPALGIRLIAGLLLGLLGSAGVVVARRWLAPTFQSEGELARELHELASERPAAVLAVVPESATARVGRMTVRAWRGAAPPAAPSVAFAPSSAFAEAFRHLRTNLYLAGGRQPPQVLLLSSPSPGDGKSVCARALAAALAADGKHVLLLDADLRRQARDAGRGGAVERGLGEVLAGRVHWSDVVKSASGDTGSGNTAFDAIPAGAPAPGAAELLSGPAFPSLLAYLRKSYDFVVIDSPPFPLVVDALVVASHADCVLSVLRIGNSVRDAAHAHLQRFGALGARHGVIVNGVHAPAAYGQYGYGATYAAALPADALAAPDRAGAPA